MAVNLSDLVDSLQREVSPPGSNLYPAMDESQWIGHLSDAFWEARLSGVLAGYTEENGVVIPQHPGAPDLPRELQQLIVLFAGFRIALTAFQNVNSSYRAKAGPVEYEVQKSAQTLRGLLDALRSRMDVVLNVLAETGQTNTLVFDRAIQTSYVAVIR